MVTSAVVGRVAWVRFDAWGPAWPGVLPVIGPFGTADGTLVARSVAHAPIARNRLMGEVNAEKMGSFGNL